MKEEDRQTMIKHHREKAHHILRQKADYNSVANIAEQDARDIVEQSKDFIAKLESLL